MKRAGQFQLNKNSGSLRSFLYVNELSACEAVNVLIHGYIDSGFGISVRCGSEYSGRSRCHRDDMEGDYVADLGFGKHRFDCVSVRESALEPVYRHAGNQRAFRYSARRIGTRYASVRGDLFIWAMLTPRRILPSIYPSPLYSAFPAVEIMESATCFAVDIGIA